MPENYKVNFRTKINEFKRKYNKLVGAIESGGIGGTKLYKHSIEFRDYNAVTIVSTRKTPFDLTNQDDLFEYTNSFKLFGGWVSTAEYDAGRITWLDYDTNKLLVRYYDTSEEQYISLEISVSDDQDAVTPL